MQPSTAVWLPYLSATPVSSRQYTSAHIIQTNVITACSLFYRHLPSNTCTLPQVDGWCSLGEQLTHFTVWGLLSDNQQTNSVRVLVEKLLVPQLVIKFTAFYNLIHNSTPHISAMGLAPTPSYSRDISIFRIGQNYCKLNCQLNTAKMHVSCTHLLSLLAKLSVCVRVVLHTKTASTLCQLEARSLWLRPDRCHFLAVVSDDE
jgi:hypothetical protein